MDHITHKIASLPLRSQYFSLEFFPPKTAEGFQNLQPRLQRLRVLNPLFVCVTFSAGGATASKSLELADVCQNQLGLTTCLHLTCTNLKKDVIDHVLSESKRLGISNILALRGDEPRPREYADPNGETNGLTGKDVIGAEEGQDVQFYHASDLIRYIKSKHGNYFCIGAATYPEGHPTPSSSHPDGYFQSVDHDLPYLIEKVEAGADFLMTQLFFDVDKYVEFERRIKQHDKFRSVPVIPGLMPVQGWQSLSRTCKLAKVGLPAPLRKRLEAVKGDDEAIKQVGVDIICKIIEKINAEKTQARPSSVEHRNRRLTTLRGFHFYTLNLERSVAQILERCDLVSSLPPASTRMGQLDLQEEEAITIDEDSTMEVVGPTSSSSPNRAARGRRRRSSAAHNRVVVSRPSTSSEQSDYEAVVNETGLQRDDPTSKENTLAIAEGEGSLGREATWDDFPNGRWGDARSPAYAATNNYSLHPQLAPAFALKLWSYPATVEDITSIFHRYICGSISSIPWSEDADDSVDGGLRPETALIKNELLRLNERNWWTVASQPAINARNSNDPVVGWGPKKRGFVWQKPFVEFFLPTADWKKLKRKLSDSGEDTTYFAGNASGAFESSDAKSVNPVTWGVFKDKEIVTPTIIEAVSFRAWQDEAFSIWREWCSIFPPSSPSARLLGRLLNDLWLVNVISHDYMDGNRLWNQLLTD